MRRIPPQVIRFKGIPSRSQDASFQKPAGGDVSKRQADAQASSGKMLRMKESYGEGTASHAGSESCGHGRKAMDEALTGGTTGQGESAAKYPQLQDADALTRCGRPHLEPRQRERFRSLARSATLARRDTSCAELGRSRVRPSDKGTRSGRSGKSMDVIQ